MTLQAVEIDQQIDVAVEIVDGCVVGDELEDG